jgi:hypothetical protein
MVNLGSGLVWQAQVCGMGNLGPGLVW